MFNYNTYTVTEERQPWRSAYEIEIEARKQEEWYLQTIDNGPASTAGRHNTGLSALLKASLRMLATLVG